LRKKHTIIKAGFGVEHNVKIDLVTITL